MKDGLGRCALHFASVEGQECVIPYLLRTAPSTINVCDTNGHTPLALSLMSGHLGTAQLLLDAGANPDKTDEEGITPLHKASGFNDTKGIALLCEYGANMYIQSKGGTPLHWAAGGGHAGAVEALLSNGANPNSCNSEGITPLVMAAILGEEGSEAVGHIVNSKACTSSTIVAQGLTALHIAADIGCLKSVKFLLKAGNADRAARTVNSLGKLPIQLAAEAGHREIVRAIHKRFPFQDAGGSEKKDTSVDEIMTMFVNEEETQRAEEGETRLPQTCGGNNIPITGQTKVTPSNEERKLADAAKEEGNALLRKQMHNEAVVAYTRAIEIDDGNHIYWSNRSAAWMELDNYDRLMIVPFSPSVSVYSTETPFRFLPEQQSIRMYAFMPTSFAFYCFVFFRALVDAEMCATLAPEWPKSCFRAATALLALKRHEDAAMAAWKGVKIDNDNEQLKHLLKVCVEEGRNCSKQQQHQLQQQQQHKQ